MSTRALHTVAPLVLLLAACAAPRQYVWVKDGGSEQEFYEARGQCQAQAFGLHPGASTMQVAIVFSGCMQGKGWRSVPAA